MWQTNVKLMISCPEEKISLNLPPGLVSNTHARSDLTMHFCILIISHSDTNLVQYVDHYGAKVDQVEEAELEQLGTEMVPHVKLPRV